MQKEKRHHLILELIANEQLRTQQDLIWALNEKGVEATQSSISRDIAFLGVIKRSGYYQVNPNHMSQVELINTQQLSYIHHVEVIGQHQIILKTQPATAQSVASAIDHADWPEVAGTIAGDDTVFIAIRTPKTINYIARRLRRI